MILRYTEPNYKLFPYERDLRRRELAAITNNHARIHLLESQISLPDYANEAYANLIQKKASYIGDIITPTTTLKSVQSSVEQGCAQSKKRQVTRYLTHGIHEYKGKFNPQIVRSILNILNLQPGQKVLDPFCGSGTTLLEAARLKIFAFGYDINPLAIMICHAKFNALKLRKNELVSNVYTAIKYANNCKSCHSKDNPRDEYLGTWLPPNIHKFLENYKSICLNFRYPEVYLIIASNLIRGYSYQEPSDLRIRRRTSAFPTKPIEDALISSASEVQRKIESFSQYENFNDFSEYHAEVKDIRFTSFSSLQFDGVVTSPPYATALPYIDIHRISMVWLGLINPTEILPLEKSLIGSREIGSPEKKDFETNFENHLRLLPFVESQFCLELAHAIGKNDGFRRRAVPINLLRYFIHMQRSLKNIFHLVKSGASCALIIGANKTKLGETNFDINTPAHIISLAQSVGWELHENIPLQTYQRFELHSKNSINNESLIILRSPKCR